MDQPVLEKRSKPAIGQKAERSFLVVRDAINEEARTVELAFSSEAPYERWWGTEILDHTKGACDLTRLKTGGPLLCDHDTRDQVGVIESVRIDTDRVGRAVVRFGRSERAEEIFRDVVDGIRQNVSVGYLIDDLVLAEKHDDQETYRVTRWTPFEISLVSVPADFTVGVGRAAEQPPHQETRMTAAVTDPPVAPDLDKIKAEAASTANAAAAGRAKEILAIAAQFKHYNVEAITAEALGSGASVETYRAKVMEHIATKPLPTPSAANLDLSRGDMAKYSLMRGIRALVDRNWEGAGFEQECSAEILKRAGMKAAPNGGFFVPYDILAKRQVQQRDMTAGTANAGGYLVATDNLGGSFIDLLRNRAMVAQLGATMLSGLVGNVTVPKLTAGGTAYWLSTEATAITESQQTLGQLALSPKNLGAYTEVSRQLMMQSDPSVDALVMNDLAKVLGIAIDLAALSGSGASGQPTGVVGTAGIGSVVGTSIDYAKVLEFQTDVAGANALSKSCAYLTTPAVAALLLQRVKVASTYSPLWEGGVLDGQMCGFRAGSTLQMAAASMLFGDFSQIVIGEWGMLEIALNPYANFAAAISGIRAIQTVDVGVRQAGAFSLATSIT
jgi:HK97 family phage major capsid protein